MWIKALEPFTCIVIENQEYRPDSNGYVEVPDEIRDAAELAGFVVVNGPPVSEPKPKAVAQKKKAK
jgi:hypothetical protein